MQKSRYSDINKSIFKFAIPIAITGLINQLQMLIDTAFLGHYSMTLSDGSVISGTDFLSAVGNVFFPYIVSLSFFWAIPTGAIILISQRLGAKEPEKAKAYSEASIKYNSFLSIGVFVLWQFLGPTIFSLMGVKEPILSLSHDYLRAMSLELIPLGFFASLGASYQGMGITRYEMEAGILRSIANIFLDWVLIFGRFGCPELGAFGAGLATALSGYIANFYFLFRVITCKRSPFKISFTGILKAKLSTYSKVFKLGLPTGLEDVLWNMGNLVLATMLNYLSSQAVGIYRLITQIEGTPVYFYYGIARAVTTLVGNRTGERDIPGAKRTAFAGTGFSAIFAISFSLIFLIFPRSILSIFSNDAETIQRAIPYLRIVSIAMFPRSINIVSGNAIRGYGDTLWMFATQVFGIAFVISSAWFFIFHLNLGILGIFISLGLDETIRGIINTIRFYRGETSIFHKALKE